MKNTIESTVPAQSRDLLMFNWNARRSRLKAGTVRRVMANPVQFCFNQPCIKVILSKTDALWPVQG